MNLYIANTTKQRHIFTFRMVETGRLTHIPINAGEQAKVLKDVSPEEVEAVIQHHEVYGLVDAAKIDQSRTYIGLCYSTDKPVPAGVIEKALRDNDDFLTRDAYALRQASLAALDDTLRNNGTGYNGDMEFSVEQAKNVNDSDDTPVVKETIATARAAGKK